MARVELLPEDAAQVAAAVDRLVDHLVMMLGHELRRVDRVQAIAAAEDLLERQSKESLVPMLAVALVRLAERTAGEM